MKTLRFYLALLVFCFASTSTTFGVIGYYNLFILPGDNLVANLLDNGDNTLNSLFSNPYIQDGATFTMWDSAANQFLPTSTYEAASMTWSIDYTFTFGEGAVFHSTSGFTNTFVGSVYSGFDINTEVLNWNPDYAAGLHLIANPIPRTGALSFQDTVGRGPLDGETVRTLNPYTQTYALTTYHAGSGWDNGTPNLSVGQAAWFDLVAVPEPSGLALAGLCTAILINFRRRTFGS